MPTVFFVDWQLWEKMTFVLALAIVAVFTIGLVKLWWKSRQIRKQEIKDKEKRARIQELRKSGLIVESKRGNDIPFGVRALESGMEIDGIWVSRSTTPILESLKGLHSSESSCSPSTGSNASNSFGAGTPHAIPYPGTYLSVSQQIQGSFARVASSEFLTTPRYSRSISGKFSAAYKPRRSSHLRFSSYGDMRFHEETLSQLEGGPRQSSERNHEPQPSEIVVNSSSSSSTAAADNEIFSGSSSESDGIMCHIKPKDRSEEVEWASSQNTKQTECIGKGPSAHNANKNISGTHIRRNNGDYVSIPLSSPPRKISNPFATPNVSPVIAPTPGTSIRELRNEKHLLGEAQWPLLSQDFLEPPEPPRFGVGDLHANKAVRKVNSGFEVLPAGTFGTATECFSEGFGKPYAIGQPQARGERRSSRKLQKRARNSVTGRRNSRSFEGS